MNPYEDLDVQGLHEHYLACRRQFIDQATKDTHEALLTRLMLAARSCDLCLTTFVEYLGAGTAYLEHYLEQSQQKTRTMLEQTQESLGTLGDITERLRESEDPTHRKLLEAQGHLVSQTARGFVKTHEITLDLDAFNLEAQAFMVRTTFASLGGLFEVTDAHQIRAALVVLGKALAALIPGVGLMITSYDAGKALHKPRFNVADAAELLQFLDEFTRGTQQWCLGTQLAIDGLEDIRAGRIPEDGSWEPDIDAAMARIQARFRRLLEEPGDEAGSPAA